MTDKCPKISCPIVLENGVHMTHVIRDGVCIKKVLTDPSQIRLPRESQMWQPPTKVVGSDRLLSSNSVQVLKEQFQRL